MIETAKRSSGTNEQTSVAWRGIDLCREGDWQEGLYWLTHSMQSETLPGLGLAYLGYGLAKHRAQHKRGLELCRRAIDLDFYRAETYVLLAKTHLLLGDRRAAFDTLGRGLQIDPTDSELMTLRRKLGERKQPILRFLPRNHILNRTLGKLRHRLRRN